MTREEAREYVYQQMLHYRKIERFVYHSPLFEQACDEATEEHLEGLGEIIKTMNSGLVRRWCKKIFRTDWTDYTIPQLRTIARRYHVPTYQLLDRTNLIEAITIEKRRRVISGEG